MDEIAVDTLLLILKIAFLVLLYLFIWRIVRSASRDLRLPQESFILPGGAPAPRRPVGGKLVVLKSPTLPEGWEVDVDSTPITVGRGTHNQVELRGDDFASATHARIEPRQDGVWLEDAGSTNGTFVNGIRIDRARKLTTGDVVRVGETDLRYER